MTRPIFPDAPQAISNHLARLKMDNIAKERICPYCGFPNRVWLNRRWVCFSNFCTVITNTIATKYAESGYNNG